MTTIAGIMARNGAPVDVASLTLLSKALAREGSIEQAHCLGSLGMVAHRPRQGRVSHNQDSIVECRGDHLSWSGRLDNLEEIADRLADTGDLPGHPPTAPQIALATYRRWGVEGFAFLVGDFTLALWDANDRTLVLARDGIGIEPLFYQDRDALFSWSSRARPLTRLCASMPELDERYLASFFTRYRLEGHSPFRDIHMVPAGHALLVSEAGSRLQRFWAIDPERRIDYRRDSDYEEHFYDLFRQSIRRRLVSSGPVFCDLSGGLDSSSIVCVADQILAAGESVAPDLQTVSYTYRTAKSSVETQYSDLVEAQRGRRGLHIPNEDHPLLALNPESSSTDLPTTQLAYRCRYDYLASRMSAAGSRVLLRGVGGDQVLWGNASSIPFPVSDHLAQNRWLSASQACYRWSRARRVPWFRTAGQAFQPLLGQRWERRRWKPLVAPWLDAGFIARTEFEELAMGPRNDLGYRRPSQIDQYRCIREVCLDLTGELYLQNASVDVRMPFLDRQLVEFALAVPLDQLLRRTETRSVLRRSLRGVLPEPLRVRRSKSSPDEAIYRTLASSGGELERWFSGAEVCRLGIVDARGFSEALGRARHGVSISTPQLLRTFGLEVWLRSLRTEQDSIHVPKGDPSLDHLFFNRACGAQRRGEQNEELRNSADSRAG